VFANFPPFPSHFFFLLICSIPSVSLFLVGVSLLLILPLPKHTAGVIVGFELFVCLLFYTEIAERFLFFAVRSADMDGDGSLFVKEWYIICTYVYRWIIRTRGERLAREQFQCVELAVVASMALLLVVLFCFAFAGFFT
jgi:hypothetical protein